MAIRLFELAAQQGDASAIYNLGVMYEYGEGVEQSYERAVEYYKQAAHLGYDKAQFNLGLLYANGRGVAQSYGTAAELYEQAVQQGHPSAMYNLGVLYAKGQGVETDIFKAKELFTQAVALGSGEAIGLLKLCDDEERKAAVLDTNAIVCCFCGLPQTETRNFSKTKCPCKSTWYCNTTCQKKHWLGHRNECIRLRAEIKQKKKEQAAQSKLDKSQTDVDGGTSNAAVVQEDTHDEDGKEKMTTSTQETDTEKTKQEEEKEEEEEEEDTNNIVCSTC
jgi:TPR repeat protein